MKFTAIKNFPYVRDREARSIEQADKVWRSRWVFFRRRTSFNPSCVSVAISEFGGLTSRYTTRHKIPISLQAYFSRTITSSVEDLGSAKSAHAKPIHLEPRIMSRIPGPILSLTRVAVKRRANSISQARRLDRAIHRAGQLIVSCL
jgi:hypothetical protein